jgi:hypothetical protein
LCVEHSKPPPKKLFRIRPFAVIGRFDVSEGETRVRGEAAFDDSVLIPYLHGLLLL